MAEEQFIDAEQSQDYYNQKNSYDDILLRQIQRCVEALSKEERGGYFNNDTKVYVEDTREVIINSVETMRMLLTPYIKSNDAVDKIKKSISEYYEQLGNTIIIQNGQRIKLKDARLSPTHELFQRYKDFKVECYREMFEHLMVAYQKKKGEIQALSYE